MGQPLRDESKQHRDNDMTDQSQMTRPLPVADRDVFEQTCIEMIDWIGTIEMPEERVGIREAAGNLGGILIGLMRESKAHFYNEESTNVGTLTGYLKDSVDSQERADILSAIHECAIIARDNGNDIQVEFK